MGIQSIIGDIKSTVGQNIKSFLESAWGAVNGIASNIGTFVANVYGGGFAGVSDFGALKTAITNYSNNVQEIVNTYDVNADLEQTFKGKAGEEMRTFITSTKSLLDAYVKLVEKWNTELDDAYEKYQQGDTSLQSNVSSDAQAVEQAAQNVNIG